MKNLINSIENNQILTPNERDLLIDSISLGSSVLVCTRMVQTEIKMAILETLHKTEKAMTISEIQMVVPHCTVQRLSAMARQLRNLGLVKKTYITTNNSIIIHGKKYPEKIAKFSLNIN